MFFQSTKDKVNQQRASNLPVQYMQQRAPSLDVAFRDPRASYAPESGRFTVSNEVDIIWVSSSSDGAQLRDLASAETERFKDIMEAFIQEQPSRTVLKGFDIRGQHSWAEVMGQLDLAKQSHEDKAKGRQGVLRKGARWFSNHVETIDPWVRLIPETDYSSVICGGLKFVFAAAAENSRVREKILEAIEGLPDDITEVNNCLQLFNQVVNDELWAWLKEKALRLYVTILATIEGMLTWLDERGFKKALKALVLQKAYGRDLMTSITALQNRSQDLRRAATACHHSVNVQSNLLNRETYKATQDTRAVVREISAHGSVVIDELHEIREELRDSRDSGKAVVAADALNSQLELLKGDLIAAVEQSLWRKFKEHVQTEPSESTLWQKLESNEPLLLTTYVSGEPYSAHLRPELFMPISSIPVQESQLPRLERKQIQGLLDIETGQSSAALARVLRVGRQEIGDYRAVSRRLLGTRRLLNWLQSDMSDIILLKSLEDSERITRLSHFCGTLLTSLKDAVPAIPVHYLCGVMSLNRPRGRFHMLRSFTFQLLEPWPEKRTFPMDLDITKLMDCDFESIWGLFVTAVLSHPHATIFLIVDGPRRHSEEDFMMTVEKIMWFQNNMTQTTRLKVLITSPAPSRLIRLLPEDNQVILPSNIQGKLGLNDDKGHQALVRSYLNIGRSQSVRPESRSMYGEMGTEDNGSYRH